MLASRLTEDGSTRVLLLEAGGDDAKNPNVHMPPSSAALQGTSFSWNYKSEPQKGSSQDLKDQVSKEWGQSGSKSKVSKEGGQSGSKSKVSKEGGQSGSKSKVSHRRGAVRVYI